MESDSHLAVLDEILKVSHHSVIQQTWAGDLLGARHDTRHWNGDLNKYNAPWPQGAHIQPGFTDRSQCGVVGGAEDIRKLLSQAREEWKTGSGKASHKR